MSEADSPSSPTTGASVNLPGRVYIVRHGERLDHHHSDWCHALHTDRAHDSPLTDEGRLQGRLAGAHILARQAAGEGCRPIDAERGDETFTIVSSPLVRCVDTAHHIALTLGVSSILIDPALIEVGWYMADTLQRYGRHMGSAKPLVVAPFCGHVARGDAKQRKAALEANEVEVVAPHAVHGPGSTPVLVPQEGLHLPRETLKRYVSPLVDLEYRGLLPELLSVSQCRTTGVMQRGDGSELCCVDTSKRCMEVLTSPDAQDPELHHWRKGPNHTLILVGHGDSIHAWFKALTRRPNQPFPSPFEFNCLSELKLGRDAKDRPTYQQVGEYFTTPHLKGSYRTKLMEVVRQLDSTKTPVVE